MKALSLSSRVISNLALFSILLVITKNARANESEMTLCQPHEDIYFSCQTENGKIMSLCASGNISPKHGYVQLRLGMPNQIDFQFPRKRSAPQNIFLIRDIYVEPKRTIIEEIKFKNGKYNYEIVTGGAKGLFIERGGKPVSNLFCEEDGIYLGPNRKIFRGIITAPDDDLD